DANLVQIENRLGVLIAARGNKVVIEGAEDDVARAREVLVSMHERLLGGQELDSGSIEALIALSNEPTLDGIITTEASGPPIMIRTRRKTIVPRTAAQADYMRQLASRDIIFALGPAGQSKWPTGSASCPATPRRRSVPVSGRSTMRSTTACRPSKWIAASPAARSRSPPSPSCAAAP